jgi:hypothetical protein
VSLFFDRNVIAGDSRDHERCNAKALSCQQQEPSVGAHSGLLGCHRSNQYLVLEPAHASEALSPAPLLNKDAQSSAARRMTFPRCVVMEGCMQTPDCLIGMTQDCVVKPETEFGRVV